MQSLVTAISDENWSAALELALAGWRTTRQPQLAQLIDHVGQQLYVPLPEHELQQTWCARALPYNPAHVSTLVAHVTVKLRGSEGTWAALAERWSSSELVKALAAGPALPQHRNWLERLLAILTWPDDPRISATLADWLTSHEVLVRSPEFDLVYGAIADRLVALGDPRVVPQLAAFLADPAPGFREQRALVARVHAALGQLSNVDDPAIAAAITALAARTAERDALWTQPAARGVLADALVAIGDPRGELITLQRAIEQEAAAEPARDPRTKRVGKLLDAWWDHWLGGALASLIVRDGTVFAGGMLAQIRVGYPTTPLRAWAAARGHRELASVETVLVGRVPAIEYAHFVAALPNLVTLEVDQPATLDELAWIEAVLPITTLAYVRAATLTGVIKPSLETFGAFAPSAPNLARVVLAPGPLADELDGLVAALPGLFPHLAAIELLATSRVAARDLTAQFAGVPLVTIR